MSCRLRKTCRVCGAEGEGEVRRRMEWSFTWAVKLGGGGVSCGFLACLDEIDRDQKVEYHENSCLPEKPIS